MSNAYNAIQRTVAQRAAAGSDYHQQIADIFGLGGVGGGGNRKAGLAGSGGVGGAPRAARSCIKWSPAWFKPRPSWPRTLPFFPALTVLGLGAGVAGEFADDDPIGRNALQSVCWRWPGWPAVGHGPGTSWAHRLALLVPSPALVSDDSSAEASALQLVRSSAAMSWAACMTQ